MTHLHAPCMCTTDKSVNPLHILSPSVICLVYLLALEVSEDNWQHWKPEPSVPVCSCPWDTHLVLLADGWLMFNIALIIFPCMHLLLILLLTSLSKLHDALLLHYLLTGFVCLSGPNGLLCSKTMYMIAFVALWTQTLGCTQMSAWTHLDMKR